MNSFRFFRPKLPLFQQVRNQKCCSCPKPRHLICFKNWTASMVMEILNSAMNLKCRLGDTHQKQLVRTLLRCVPYNMPRYKARVFLLIGIKHSRLKVLSNCKVMILQEVNEPVLNMAVSKAATLLGAHDVNIIDHLVWEYNYLGRVFSYMADAIFVATTTHMCVQRFAEQSSVPVMCMRSRTHASIQALATVMSIIEEFGTMKCVNVSYLGSPHPVLNSYLLLCPMLGANIRFKCCCDKCPVSPLLYKASEDMTANTQTESKECKGKNDALKNASVIIAGPTHAKKHEEFKFSVQDIECCTKCPWVFYHTCPRGEEVDDDLFLHCNARTFTAFENMHFIAAALMANAIKGHVFKGGFCNC